MRNSARVIALVAEQYFEEYPVMTPVLITAGIMRDRN